MDQKGFEQLINRCLSGQATKEELALVEKWLDRRGEKDPFKALSADEKEETRIRILKRLSSRMMGSDPTLRKEKSGVNAITYRVAAAILPLALLTYSLLKSSDTPQRKEIAIIQSVSSAADGKKIILSDSSIVWLRGSSSIQYPEKFEGKYRNVKLTGEALFEVSRDQEHPFVIECGGLTAKVLGTSFNIKSNETHIEVLVLTGKVALSSKGNSKSLIVHPNEKAVYHAAQDQIAKVVAKENEKSAKTSGTQYSMRFNATPMKEIIRRIEGKFEVRVSLNDERLNNCTITADFTDQSLERTLSMIAQTLEIEYEINNGHVTLKGAGCD